MTIHAPLAGTASLLKRISETCGQARLGACPSRKTKMVEAADSTTT